MAFTTKQIGRRVYIEGNTYPIKDALKAQGCTFDSNLRQWWIGAGNESKIADILRDAPAIGSDTARAVQDLSDKPVYAKVKYKGRTYFQIGRSDRTGKLWLTVLDGTINFWASADLCETVKTYSPRKNGFGRYAREEYQTLGGIRRFVDKSRRDDAAIARGETPDGYCVDLEDGMLKPRGECDMPSD